MRITKIEISKEKDRLGTHTLTVTAEDGSMYEYGGCYNNSGSGFFRVKEATKKPTRVNKIDAKVLDYLKNKDNWRPPSHRQIASAVGCHYSYIKKAFSNLQRDGLIDTNLELLESTK